METKGFVRVVIDARMEDVCVIYLCEDTRRGPDEEVLDYLHHTDTLRQAYRWASTYCSLQGIENEIRLIFNEEDQTTLVEEVEAFLKRAAEAEDPEDPNVF